MKNKFVDYRKTLKNKAYQDTYNEFFCNVDEPDFPKDPIGFLEKFNG